MFMQIALIPLTLQEMEWHPPECITVQELAGDLPAPRPFPFRGALYVRTRPLSLVSEVRT